MRGGFGRQALGFHLCSSAPRLGTQELGCGKKSEGTGGLGWGQTGERHKEEQLERS